MSQDGPGNGDQRAPVPSAATEGLPEGLLAPGQVLGDRYQIKSQLGRGGMGEVWRAFDLKLRVEVALKAMLPDLFKDEKRRDLLRREVRAAREVVSPNVCRIFDLIEVDGSELVSMEYVDGGTLLSLLAERGPLDLKEAQDIASQFLAGLEAIHQAGLIHRDVKPENIMITRAGRVVLMDFGLARQEDSGAGTVSGTPAYMAPEQAAGLKVDARADVYAAGVVLAEMVSPEGIKNLESRQSVWDGIRQEPAKVPDSPWAPVLKKAVAKEPDQRHNSAHTLIRELEDVTLRVEGAEDLTPYPGLASFTEEDAEYFFGREAEVEQMWRRLEGAPRMLALVGPSGAGKSSFLRAGLFATKKPGWAHVICTPGNDPRASLRRAVISALETDTEALRELAMGGEDASVAAITRWRQHHEQALVVVDQFEEVLTQNTVDEQMRFAALLSRLVIEADVFLLLSMRDDFLALCHSLEPLRPIFHELTVLDPPTGASLRRALVQPATKCGYRFEDDDLVEEMLAEVEGERGALPLLAFAMARLWEKRDREKGEITRQTYRDIGGVGGALARHAEATIDRVGADRIPVVRELFRNLVTAEGTRAVREWDELLSIFRDSYSESRAEEVLRALIDDRLLTSYEVREGDEEPTRRIEIIHESLLTNWPRLVRWQTQDAEGVQLRDELRQGARAWDEHDRSNDRLWTGTAFREFQLWRERYPGGLTEIEEAFARAMTSFAMRRRRRCRAAVAAALVTALVVVAVTTILWRQSVLQEKRAEAANLLSRAQLALESYPTAAVAYATASLELSDSPEARRLALQALWKGPTAFVVNEVPSWEIAFSLDGQWLAQATDARPHRIHVIGADGTDDLLEDVHDGWVRLRMDRESGVFATIPWAGMPEPWALWSAPKKTLLSKAEFGGFPENIYHMVFDLKRRRMLMSRLEDDHFYVDAMGFDGTAERLGRLPFDLRSIRYCADSPGGRWTAMLNGQGVHLVEFGSHDMSEPRRLKHIEGPVVDIECDPLGRFVAARYEDGNIRLWDLEGRSPPKVLHGPSGAFEGHFEMRPAQDGSFFEVLKVQKEKIETWIWSLETEEPAFVRHIDLGRPGGVGGWTLNPVEHQIVSILNPDPKIRLWPLRAPAGAAPVIMQRGDAGAARRVEIHPSGGWLAESGTTGLTLWPVARPYPIAIDRYEERVGRLVFGPGGRWLASSSFDRNGTVRLWHLEGDNLPPARIVYEAGIHAFGIAASPDGEEILLGDQSGTVKLLSLGREAPVDLPGAVEGGVLGVAISPDGRFAAASGIFEDPMNRVIRVWDVASLDEVTTLGLGDRRSRSLQFTKDGHLLSGGDEGLVRWDLETGESETLFEESVAGFAVNSGGTRVLLSQAGSERASLVPYGRAVVLDLVTGMTSPLTAHGDRVTAVAIDAEGTMVVTGDLDGVIRVGPTTGGEPQLLLGNPDEVYDVAVDPSGRWIASSSGMEVRLWPMPDLSKPPLHTLPHDELIAKLKTLTNLRVVRDEESATGWKLTHDPFPGWETVPSL